MATITQDMRYRLSLIKYAQTYGAKAAVQLGGNRACPLYDRDYRTIISCDKADGGVGYWRGAAAVCLCHALCADAVVWKAAGPVYF